MPIEHQIAKQPVNFIIVDILNGKFIHKLRITATKKNHFNLKIEKENHNRKQNTQINMNTTNIEYNLGFDDNF